MSIRDDIVDWVTSEIAEVSMHDGDPGATGANEIAGSGSSGEYQRLEPTYTPSSGGESDLDDALEFAGPDNQQATHYGLWRSGSSWWAGRPLVGQPVNFNSDGRIDLTSARIAVDFAGAFAMLAAAAEAGDEEASRLLARFAAGEAITTADVATVDAADLEG